MKLVLFLTLALSLSATAGVFSQNQRVSFEFEDATILEVLNEIKSQTGLSFIYSEEKIQELDRVSVDAAGKTVEEVLNEIFGESNLECRFEENVIMVVDKKPKPIIEVEQQKKVIKGKVTDKDGIGLPGVSVVIKGTNTGVATDIDGNYLINIERDKAILVFSFVGMISQEIAFNGQTMIDVVLKADSEQMAEVVVTGYQVVSRERASGSFARVKEEQMERAFTTTINERLDGIVPGMLVSEDDEGNLNFTIRGQSTINANVSPLIVVDGFPIEGKLADINPDDIKSVNVLRDAAAASVWGAQAANGVVVITTKSGAKEQKPVINFSSSFTIVDKPDLMKSSLLASPDDAIEAIGEYIDKGSWNMYSYHGLYYDMGDVVDAYYQFNNGAISEAERNSRLAEAGKNNYLDEYENLMLKKGKKQKYNFSIRGGGVFSDYYASLSYEKFDIGLKGDNNNEKVNFLVNNNIDITNRFKLRLGLSGYFGKAASNELNQRNSAWGLNYNQIPSGRLYDRILDQDGNPVLKDMFAPYYTMFRYYEAGVPELVSNVYLNYDDLERTDKTFNLRSLLGINYKLTENFNIDVSGQYEINNNKYEDLYSPESSHVNNLKARFMEVLPFTGVLINSHWPEGYMLLCGQRAMSLS